MTMASAKDKSDVKEQCAFTLLELLVAVAAFALVLVAINGIFYGAVRLRNKTSQSIEDALPLQQTVAIIKQDLQCLVAPNGKLTGMLQTGGTTVPAAQQQGGTDIYTCNGSLSDANPWGNVQKVTYLLRNSDTQSRSDGKDLIRVVTRNLLPTAQEESVDHWMMSGVEKFTLLYYDGTMWKDTWDSTTDTNGLPQGLKVEMILAANQDEKRSRIPIEITVPVMVQSLTNQALLTSTTSTQ